MLYVSVCAFEFLNIQKTFMTFSMSGFPSWATAYSTVLIFKLSVLTRKRMHGK